MDLELDALGAEGEVGEPLVAPEAGERGVVRHAAVQRELGGCGRGMRGGRRGGGAGGGGAGALRRHRGARQGDNEGTPSNLSSDAWSTVSQWVSQTKSKETR